MGQTLSWLAAIKLQLENYTFKRLAAAFYLNVTTTPKLLK